MATEINKYQEIMEKFKKEGKVTILNREKDLKAMKEMNKCVEKTKKEYHLKNANSEIEASTTFVR